MTKFTMPMWKLYGLLKGLLIIQFSVVMRLEGSSTEIPSSETNALNYMADAPNSHIEGTSKSYPTIEEGVGGKIGMDEPTHEEGVSQPKKAAKIHDFCLGIPFGGLVLSGGLVGFLFSKNPATLSTGILFGGALLALSTFSLKIWRQGKSSLTFILGQAALSAVLLGKHFQSYSMTKKIFPTGFYAVISAAMLCFYSSVVISGGNPAPKKLKLATSAPS
ncbi:hypothetical protein HHK36_017248 [Tetracentron sinense]|uniref:Uncharacterized protein n=1 Tax=Tetracentron sinense TaxID=13715 RepID=A0A834Z453_TETSI|nr:hypothetical protein HHK36_017248 [Tetracentron sinense]